MVGLGFVRQVLLHPPGCLGSPDDHARAFAWRERNFTKAVSPALFMADHLDDPFDRPRSGELLVGSSVSFGVKIRSPGASDDDAGRRGHGRFDGARRGRRGSRGSDGFRGGSSSPVP